MPDNEKYLAMHHWPVDDRPRQKLIHKGRAALSDAELLAILIGSGSKEEDALSLSRRILASVAYNLLELGKCSVKSLCQFKGIGPAKAVVIVAALELSRRRVASPALSRKRISSSGQVYALLQPLISDLPHEEFWILYLNNSNKLICKDRVSKGGITATLVDTRLVLKKALEVGAVALILGHNHPSGSLQPSKADTTLTKKLKRACESVDIKILDHLIVTEKAYFSFADEGLL